MLDKDEELSNVVVDVADPCFFFPKACVSLGAQRDQGVTAQSAGRIANSGRAHPGMLPDARECSDKEGGLLNLLGYIHEAICYALVIVAGWTALYIPRIRSSGRGLRPLKNRGVSDEAKPRP
jgi:hypothetical protein